MMIVAELRGTILADLVDEAKRLQKKPRTSLVNFPYLEVSAENNPKEAA
jgi:hypothetical protein